jgi:hypothetical protein
LFCDYYPAWLFLHDDVKEVVVRTGQVELSCFRKATMILMDLRFLGLALPPAGVFEALRVMHLEHFWFRGEFGIRDTMLPSLRELAIHRVRGLAVLTLNSKSLLDIHLSVLLELHRLIVVAPRLKYLVVMRCFHGVPQPVASIVAKRLYLLRWGVPCVPEPVYLREMQHLHVLGAPSISTLWSEDICAEYLDCFRAVNHVELVIRLGVSASSLT